MSAREKSDLPEVAEKRANPTSQYCYYTENLQTPAAGIYVEFARDQKLDPPKTLPKDFDISAAFSRCVWFKGEGT